METTLVKLNIANKGHFLKALNTLCTLINSANPATSPVLDLVTVSRMDIVDFIQLLDKFDLQYSSDIQIRECIASCRKPLAPFVAMPHVLKRLENTDPAKIADPEPAPPPARDSKVPRFLENLAEVKKAEGAFGVRYKAVKQGRILVGYELLA